MPKCTPRYCVLGFKQHKNVSFDIPCCLNPEEYCTYFRSMSFVKPPVVIRNEPFISLDYSNTMIIILSSVLPAPCNYTQELYIT